MTNKHNKVLIIGPGNMGYEYYKCLKNLNYEVHVIGRTVNSFKRFKAHNDIFRYESIEEFLSINDVKDFKLSIISVSVEALMHSSIQAIKAGFKRILIEKPAGLYKSEIAKLITLADKKKTQIFIAYNRRYYGSVQEALNIIKNDGGALSCHFDFTEWEKSVLTSGVDDKVLKRWFFANSTHIIDTVFFLIGTPKKISFYGRKLLDWHSGNSIMAGSGISSNKVLFSFHSNWNSAGRWSMDISTTHHKIIFCPIEELKIMKKNSIVVHDLPKDEDDTNFKPGLLKQLKDLMKKKPVFACSLSEHAKNWEIYEDMFNRRKL
jgi:predicted dehydrogenase